MKRVKRFGALVFTLAFLLGISLSVNAATIPTFPDPGDGTITVQKYDIKDFDPSNLQYGTGQALTGSEIVYNDGTNQYTWNELIAGVSGVSEAIVPQNNILYGIRFFAYDETTDTYATTASQIWDNTPQYFEWDGTELRYTVRTREINGVSGLIEMEGLKYGKYEFTELEPANGYRPVDDPFYIYMPTLISQTVDPTTGVITSVFEKNVHAYPKNKEAGQITKVLMDKKDSTVNFGSGTGANVLAEDSGLGNFFTYTITASITSLSAKTRLEIEDILDARMKVLGVTVAHQSGTDNPVTMTGGYRTEPATVTDASGSFKVIIDSTDMTDFKTDNPDVNKLIVTVRVAADTQADTGTTLTERRIVNDAVYRYVDNPNDPPPPDITIPTGEKPFVEVGDIEILKESQNGTPLDGAQFMLFTTEAAANSGTPSDANTVIADPTARGAARYTFTTASDDPSMQVDGKLVINNIQRSFTPAPAGSNTQYFSYWLVETKAPPGGYNILLEPVEITFDSATETATFNLTVINHEGFTLPRTGGNGTLIFTITGLSIITVTGLALILYRRRKDMNGIK